MLSSRRATLVVVLVAVGAAAPLAVGTAAAQDATLTVTVVDQQNSPVTNVQVTAAWANGSVTEQTRANGQALLDVPAGARVEIDVSGSSYMRNHPRVIQNATAREVRVPVAEQGQARVIVSDEDGPVRGATVRLNSGGKTAASARTDADGVARTGAVEQQRYQLTVSKPGYLQHSEQLRVGDVTEREVIIEEAIVGLDVSVQDDRFDPPRDVENATVELAPTGVRLVTLGTGEATTRVAANRDYDITVTKSGYEEVTRTISVGEDDASLTVNTSREPFVDLRAAQDAVVVGQSTQVTAVDEYGTAVEDAPITVDGTEVARTDDEGTADVPIESVGNVTIAVEHDGNSDSVTVAGVERGRTDEPTTTTDNQSTDGGFGPGFGPVAALIALLLGTLALARRR